MPPFQTIEAFPAGASVLSVKGPHAAVEFFIRVPGREDFRFGGTFQGALNLGVRIHDPGSEELLWEGRASPTSLDLRAGLRLLCHARMPSAIGSPGRTVRVSAHVVAEFEAWIPAGPTPDNAWLATFDYASHAGTGEVDAIRQEFVTTSLNRALTRLQATSEDLDAVCVERDALRARLEALTPTSDGPVPRPSLRPTSDARNANLRALDLVEREAAWLAAVSEFDLPEEYASLRPHDGRPGDLDILILGIGGFGDIVYLTALIRELALRFAGCRLFVAHTNARVSDVLDGNPYVASAVGLIFPALNDFKGVASNLDVFDLVVELRYAVTYVSPPSSRAPRDFVRLAGYKCAEWQRYVRDQWPYLNNLLARQARALGLSKLDLVGETSLLPITSRSPLELYLSDGSLPEPIRSWDYVTVHHGADPHSAGAFGLQTKNLPVGTWAEIVRLLSNAGLKTVQLGLEAEQPIPGVTLDLRGTLSFLESAAVIRGAQVHVDTEGGLVHVARAVHTPAVVAFGPTPATFFGYATNRNVEPPQCGDCWWLSETWQQTCPRDLEAPDCMASHSAREIASNALEVVRGRDRSTFSLQVSRVGEPGEAPSSQVYVSGSAESSTVRCIELARRTGGRVLVPAASYVDVSRCARDVVLLQAFSPCTLPLDTLSQEALHLHLRDQDEPAGLALLGESRRVLTIGGVLRIELEDDDAPRFLNLIARAYPDVAPRLQGAAGDLMAVRDGDGPDSGRVLLSLTKWAPDALGPSERATAAPPEPPSDQS